jgi:hypothetical protein
MTLDLSRRKRNECQLPFNIIDNPELESVVNLLAYVGDGKYTACGEVAGVYRWNFQNIRLS